MYATVPVPNGSAALQGVRIEAVGVAAMLVETFPNTHEPLLGALGSLLATSYIPQPHSTGTGKHLSLQMVMSSAS